MGVDLRLSSRDLDRTTAPDRAGPGRPPHPPRPRRATQEHPYEGRVLLHRQHGRRDDLDLPGQGPDPQPRRQAPARASTSRSGWSSTGSRTPSSSPPRRSIETEAGPIVHVVDDAGQGGRPAGSSPAQTYEGLRVITKGLDAGVPVIVEGLQMIRPGLPVKTEPAVLPAVESRRRHQSATPRRQGRARAVVTGRPRSPRWRPGGGEPVGKPAEA